MITSDRNSTPCRLPSRPSPADAARRKDVRPRTIPGGEKLDLAELDFLLAEGWCEPTGEGPRHATPA